MFSLKNEFNDWVNKYNGNMKASDFATLGFINAICKVYTVQKKLGEKSESFNRDLKINCNGNVYYDSNVSYDLNQENIIKEKGKKAIVPGAKWNVILTGAMMKAMTQEMLEVTKVRNEVNRAIFSKIDEVGK